MNLSWIEIFLADRNHQVVLDGKTSSPVAFKSGFPQGTVLGPLMFLLYINDLPSRVYSAVRLFSEECLLYRVMRDRKNAESLKTDLNDLQERERKCRGGGGGGGI